MEKGSTRPALPYDLYMLFRRCSEWGSNSLACRAGRRSWGIIKNDPVVPKKERIHIEHVLKNI